MWLPTFTRSDSAFRGGGAMFKKQGKKVIAIVGFVIICGCAPYFSGRPKVFALRYHQRTSLMPALISHSLRPSFKQSARYLMAIGVCPQAIMQILVIAR